MFRRGVAGDLCQKPEPRRMTAFALKVIEQAVEDATPAPIRPSPAVRLALAWLTLQKSPSRASSSSSSLVAASPFGMRGRERSGGLYRPGAACEVSLLAFRA